MYSDDKLSEEKLLGQAATRDDGEVPTLRSRRRLGYLVSLWGFHVTIVLVNVLMFVGTFFHRKTMLQGDCKDHMPVYSPALDAVRGTGHFQRFDGSFATPNAFKGTPNSDIDAAWASITYENGSDTLDPRRLFH